MFVAFKNNLLQPYIYNGSPRLRSIPSDRFIPYSDDTKDPNEPTIQILRIGYDQNQKVSIWGAYAKDEFIIFDDYGINGNIKMDLMSDLDNIDGINPINAIPFVYINRSHNYLVPKHDTDTIKMTKLIPILISDLNFISMFQAFSMLYIIDGDTKGLKFAPNAIWNIKSTEDERQANVGFVKPQADIDALLNTLQSELAMWLQSRGIRPGAVSELSAENVASGISKMIDEMDAFDEINKHVEYYRDAESDLWDLIINKLHPYWIKTGQINKPLFSIGAKVITNFSEQVPIIKRKDLIEELKMELDAGFTTKKRAIIRLNPKMTDSEIDQLITEIDNDKDTVWIDENENVTDET